MRALTTATGISAPEAAVEQVGPELGLGEDEHARPECIEVGAHGPGQVERTVEDAGCPKARTCQLLAGAGGSGDAKTISRKGGLDLLHQAADCQHLANGNGMKPDDGLAVGAP